MSLFKKKEDVPEIPPAPSLPDFPQDTEKKSVNLPTLQGDARDVSNRDAIKSAVEDSSEKDSGDLGATKRPQDNFQESVSLATVPEPPVKNKPLPELPGMKNPLEIPKPKQEKSQKNDIKSLEMPSDSVKKDSNETIFVRIDKFNSAKRDIGEIERDLRQIEDVLEKITDVKMKEDEEISELNKNIEEIKEKLSKIDSEVFNRI